MKALINKSGWDFIENIDESKKGYSSIVASDIGTENNFVTIQFVDMIGCDGYSDSKHVFKFAVTVIN